MLRLRDVASERLLAGDAEQRSTAPLDRARDLCDVLDAGEVGTAEPDGVDRGILDHGRDRGVRFRLAYAELLRDAGGLGGVILIGTPDAQHVGVAHADECQ